MLAFLRQPERLLDLEMPEWDSLLTAARNTNLAGRIADVVDRNGWWDALPTPVRPHILTASRLGNHQREAIARECRELESALAPLGVPLLLLKGTAYAMSGRDAARGRLFGDIDILVPRASLNEIEAALMLRGWSAGPIDPYDNRYYRQWMHELPPLTQRERGTVLDVHHHILPLTARWKIDVEALLSRRVAVPGSAFSVLAPEDMVIHSAVHLFHEGQLRNGLRDLCDLDALLRELSADRSDFVNSVLTRAIELGLAWPVDLALHLCSELLATPVPQPALSEARRRSGLGHVHRQWLLAAYRRALLPTYPPDGRPTVAAARLLLYLRAHALRMPIHQLGWHLARKAVLRTVKHTSRIEPKA